MGKTLILTAGPCRYRAIEDYRQQIIYVGITCDCLVALEGKALRKKNVISFCIQLDFHGKCLLST